VVGSAESASAGPVPGHIDDIAAVLPRFRGRFLQQPPAFSAKKIAGTPAYKLARRKAPAEIKPVEVNVHDLELRHYAEGVAELRLVCSSGFYVRSLAHDLGAALGCGAYLDALRRTRVGGFGLADAHSLAEVIAEGPAAAARVIPMDRLLTDMPAAILTEQGLRRASHGNTLTGGDFELQPGGGEGTPGGRLRLLDGSGRLVGIADSAPAGLLHPSVVLV
jgi:tRNA pseudouridine55 synthase